MKKTLLTLLALAGLTAAQAQTPVKAWYKTWITPEKCVTGITEITYDAENDYYTVKDGLAGDAEVPFYFGLSTSDDGSNVLRLYGQPYDSDSGTYLENGWYNDGWDIAYYLDSTYSAWIDLYSGSYFNISGAYPGEGTGALYFMGYTDDGTKAYTYNYANQPTLVWPATEPISKVVGKYKVGNSRKVIDCEMWNYANDISVIKGFNGIAGYDIVFNAKTGEVMSDETMPALSNPSVSDENMLVVYNRMPASGNSYVAGIMIVKKIEVSEGKVTFTYDSGNYAIFPDEGVEPVTIKKAGETSTFTYTADGIVTATATATAPAQYYNVGGARVAAPGRGIVLRRQGGKVVKIAR